MILRGQRVLLIRRAEGVAHPGVWASVSGKLEAGETAQTAAVREVREELGLASRPLRQLWECSSSDGAFWLYWWQIELVDADADPVPDPREVSELRWLSLSELPGLEPMFESDRHFFEAILPGLAVLD